MSRILRELKRGELTIKDMSVLREANAAKVQAKRTSGVLRDYSLQHLVTMSWSAKTDRNLLPFKLGIGNKTYTLSWRELQDLDREGFFRRETVPHYRLRYLDGPKVTLSVALNEEAQRDMIFHMKIEGREVFCDWYEVSRYGRFI